MQDISHNDLSKPLMGAMAKLISAIDDVMTFGAVKLAINKLRLGSETGLGLMAVTRREQGIVAGVLGKIAYKSITQKKTEYDSYIRSGETALGREPCAKS